MESYQYQYSNFKDRKADVINALNKYILTSSDLASLGYVVQGKKGCETFQATQHKPQPPGVYAIDTEQCDIAEGAATIKGLVSVVVVDCLNQKVVYQQMVNPTKQGFVCNYNEFIHGIDPDKMLLSPFSYMDVQRDLLKLISSDCILIGHDLRSDLRALQITHGKIIDTQQVYFSEYGRRMKLRDLVANELSLQIQTGFHDPTEDAFAAMYLIFHKIQEEIQRPPSWTPASRVFPGRGRQAEYQNQASDSDQQQLSAGWGSTALAIGGVAAGAALLFSMFADKNRGRGGGSSGN